MEMPMDKEYIRSVFSHMPRLETERLILRQIKVGDTNDVFEYSSDPEVTKYLTWEPHPTKYYTKKYLHGVKNAYKEGRFFDWAIVLKATGKMIGTCGFTSFNYTENICEIGYVLNPRYRGYSLMPEAAWRVIGFAFEELSARRVEARFMEENSASLRVMEKCGMQLETVHKNALRKRGRDVNIGVCFLTETTYRDLISKKE